jgi:S-adenosylmethionine/arginine decarboxylase-like enzyme
MNFNHCPEIFRKRLVIEGIYGVEIADKEFVNNFLVDLAEKLQMHIINGPFISSATGKAKPIHDGYEGQVVWAESGANTYIWTRYNFATVDIYSCKDFDTEITLNFVKDYFQLTSFSFYEIPDPIVFDYGQKIETRGNSGKGAATFAKEFIPANTIVSYVDGQVMFAQKESLIPAFAKNHVVPFSKFLYRNAFNSLAVKFNHSCDPNCYVRDLFFITTMRDIQPGEELTYSYSLICNSDWQNPEGQCLCGYKLCYGKIVPWRDLTSEDKVKFLPYTADWILLEEMKEKGMVDNLKNSLLGR